MKTEIDFAELLNAIGATELRADAGPRLSVADKPVPFVAPTLLAPTSAVQDLFSAEIVFIEAPAAVGKSTMARYLSSSRNAPLLNLAQVAVATGSLKSLVSDLPGSNPIEAFHAGKLPIIIDALDEGRMLSGENGFESFLQTAGELILRDRQQTRRPKVVMLGRHESIDLARIAIELSGDGITMSAVEVGFFGEEAAREMIDAYAKSITTPASAYQKFPVPVRSLIGAYFDAIEAALGLEKGKLWKDQMGRAFAGYAPVLSALGILLAYGDNFKDIENRLRAEGSLHAWGVIDDVMAEILKREKGKLCDQLASQITVHVPDEAYNAAEQLTFITRYVHHQPVEGLGKVPLPPKDQAAYQSLVERMLPDHPFVRGGKLENAVLGSVVLAHAVSHDLLSGVDLGLLAGLSKQPFLWRSLQKQMDADSLVDGRYLGYILASFWNEPVAQGEKIFIRSSNDGAVRVSVLKNGVESALLTATDPITLFGFIRNCDVDIAGTVIFEGSARGSQSTFEVHGNATIICHELRMTAEVLQLHGQVWFEAEQVTSPPKLELVLKNGTQVGWAGQIAQSHPWKRFTPTLLPPYSVATTDKLTRLVAECARRLSSAGAVNFENDYSVVDDERMRWAKRDFGRELPALVKLMVEHGLASKEQAPIGLMRVHFKITWRDLLAGLSADKPDLRQFIADARKLIK